jgi:hypothetical protein
MAFSTQQWTWRRFALQCLMLDTSYFYYPTREGDVIALPLGHDGLTP